MEKYSLLRKRIEKSITIGCTTKRKLIYWNRTPSTNVRSTIGLVWDNDSRTPSNTIEYGLKGWNWCRLIAFLHSVAHELPTTSKFSCYYFHRGWYFLIFSSFLFFSS